MSKTQSELFTLTRDPDLFPQELRADGSGPPPPAWAMINPRKDNLRLCSSNDLYKRLFLTQPENALFLNDSVSCFSLSFSLPAPLPSASFFFLLSPFLPPFFFPVFLPSSFFLSLLRAVCVVWCVCVTVRANTLSAHSPGRTLCSLQCPPALREEASWRTRPWPAPTWMAGNKTRLLETAWLALWFFLHIAACLPVFRVTLFHKEINSYFKARKAI